MSIFGEDLMDNIIGDELNENLRDDVLSEDDRDENTETSKTEQSIKVELKKRSVRNPRPKLNIEILSGKRGIHTIENYFKDIKFHGKGNEKHDLDEILKRLKHWAHRMYPAYKFDDILMNIERLSKKKPVQQHMQRYRQEILDLQNVNEIHDVQNDMEEQNVDEPFDEFDALINQQIANSKLLLPPITPSTAIKKANTSISSSVCNTPNFNKGYGGTSTPNRIDNVVVKDLNSDDSRIPLNSKQTDDIPEFLKNRTDLTAEQLSKIAENRRLALERLKARKAALGIK